MEATRRLMVVMICMTVLVSHIARAQQAESPGADADGEANTDEPAETGDQTNAPDEQPAGPERPWAKGVAPEEQKAALALFDQGNTHFLEQEYPQALAIYRQALEHWKHPSIHFNLAACLIHLDRPLEAYEHVEASMAFGPEALGDDVYQRAIARKKLLQGQLATVTISSEEVGAKITLDGEELFIAPGKVAKRVKPGRHQVIAEKEGSITVTEQLIALPDEPAALDIKMVALEDVRFERRWSRWKPWAVAGAGLAVAGAGLAVRLKGGSDMGTYDDRVVTECPAGCTLETLLPSTRDLKDRAELESAIGISFIAVGATAMVVGTALVFLNQPTRVSETETLSVSAGATRDGASVAVRLRF